MATVYACMVVRSYFLGEAESNLAYSGVNISRASLCEILAMKLLGYYAENKIHLVAGRPHLDAQLRSPLAEKRLVLY